MSRRDRRGGGRRRREGREPDVREPDEQAGPGRDDQDVRHPDEPEGRAADGRERRGRRGLPPWGHHGPPWGHMGPPWGHHGPPWLPPWPGAPDDPRVPPWKRGPWTPRPGVDREAWRAHRRQIREMLRDQRHQLRHQLRGRWPWPWQMFRLHARLRHKLFGWLALAVVAGGLVGGWAVRGDDGPRWLAILGGAFALWAAAGVIAWRVTMPLIRLIQVARDIGDGKLDAGKDLDRHGGELAILADAVNDMAARIGAQLGEQRELMAAVSHELRTPLGHMRILIETARDRRGPGALDPQDERILGELERELIELDRLVDQLLARSRLDVAAVDKRDVDLGELARRALERAGADPELVELDGAALRGFVDPTLITRALGNLIDNARVHGGGATAVRVSRDGAALVLAVEDAGPGFADGDAERVFAPFVRGAATGAPSTRASLGLGLALVARIAAAHDGRAWAENRPGGGARVSLALPSDQPR